MQDDGDWRADLLEAVSNVFTAETDSLRADLKRYSSANDQLPSVERLEKLIREQVFFSF